MTDRQVKFERLLAFAAGELPEREAMEMRQMIAADAELRRMLHLLELVRRTLKEDDSVAPAEDVVARAKALFHQLLPPSAPSLRTRVQEWLESVDRVVASLMFDSRARPALAGFRGAAELVRLSFESDLAEIDLELNAQEESGKATISIFGQLSATDDAGGAAAVLTSSGTNQVIAQTLCDHGGHFEMTVAPGMYDLHVRLPSGVVSAMEIEL